MVLLLITAIPGAIYGQAFTNAPVPADSSITEGAVAVQPPAHLYTPPSEAAKFHDLLFDSFGPYPVTMALLTAGVHQATDNPPDWHQGMAGFGDRFGSNMGITLVDNGTRYGLGELLKEDTAYYRCRCTGVFDRLEHATLTTLIARKDDGHEVFSVPVLAAPYVSTAVAVYGWYPSRYDYKDAFRMGNYNLLGYVASNLTYEFMPRKTGSLLGRFHLTSRRAVSEDSSQ